MHLRRINNPDRRKQDSIPTLSCGDGDNFAYPGKLDSLDLESTETPVLKQDKQQAA
jgi:hypothetical protein